MTSNVQASAINILTDTIQTLSATVRIGFLNAGLLANGTPSNVTTEDLTSYLAANVGQVTSRLDAANATLSAQLASTNASVTLVGSRLDAANATLSAQLASTNASVTLVGSRLDAANATLSAQLASTNASVSNLASASIAPARLPTSSTAAAGIVQLTDSVSNTSNTTAATAASVKLAYDLAASKVSSRWSVGSNTVYVTGSNVGIGNTAPVYPLHVSSQVANISIFADFDIASFSDSRYKTNVQSIDHAIDKVNAIGGYTFSRKDQGPDVRYAGVLAQEVEQVLPEVVHTNPASGWKSVSYGNMVALLIQAVKEQSLQIEELKRRISSLGG